MRTCAPEASRISDLGVYFLRAYVRLAWAHSLQPERTTVPVIHEAAHAISLLLWHV